MKSPNILGIVLLGAFLPGCKEKQVPQDKPASLQPVRQELATCKEINIPSGMESDEGEESPGQSNEELDSNEVDSCLFKGYLFVDTCESDRFGRCHWSGRVFSLVDGKYHEIENKEVFNEKLPDLELKVNGLIRKEMQETITNPDNSDCISEEDSIRLDSFPAQSIGAFRMQIMSKKDMYFSIPTGVGSPACMPVTEEIASIPLEDLLPYVK